MNATEQQYSAGLLRQRHRERTLQATEEQSRQRAVGEELPGAFLAATGGDASNRESFKVNTLEAGLGTLLAVMLDFLEWLGALTVAIPVVGIAIAGASAVFFMVMSGILGVFIGLWLFAIKHISPLSKDGRKVYIGLFLTVLGNGMISWLPAWVGFFAWLYIISLKKGMLSFMKIPGFK